MVKSRSEVRDKPKENTSNQRILKRKPTSGLLDQPLETAPKKKKAPNPNPEIHSINQSSNDIRAMNTPELLNKPSTSLPKVSMATRDMLVSALKSSHARLSTISIFKPNPQTQSIYKAKLADEPSTTQIVLPILPLTYSTSTSLTSSSFPSSHQGPSMLSSTSSDTSSESSTLVSTFERTAYQPERRSSLLSTTSTNSTMSSISSTTSSHRILQTTNLSNQPSTSSSQQLTGTTTADENLLVAKYRELWALRGTRVRIEDFVKSLGNKTNMSNKEIRDWFIMRNCSQSSKKQLDRFRTQTEILKEFHRKKYGNDELKLNNQDLKYLVRHEEMTREELEKWFEIMMENKEDSSVPMSAKYINNRLKNIRTFSFFRKCARLVAYLDNVFKKNNNICDEDIEKISKNFSVQPYLIKNWLVEKLLAEKYQNSLEVYLTEAVIRYEKDCSFWKRIPAELQFDILQAVRRNLTIKKVIDQNRKCGFPVTNKRLEDFVRIERIKERNHHALFVSEKQSEQPMEIDADDGETEQLDGFSENDDEGQREEDEMMEVETNYTYSETDDDDDNQQEEIVENYEDVAAVENHSGPSEEYDDIIDVAPENGTNLFVRPEIEQVDEAQMEENYTAGSSYNDDDDLIEIAYYSAQNPRIVQANNVDGKITEDQKKKLKKLFTKYGRYASNFIKEADLLNLSKEEREKLVDEFDKNRFSERPSKLMSARIQNSLTAAPNYSAPRALDSVHQNIVPTRQEAIKPPRKELVSQELYIPEGATNDWKQWTSEQVVQWASRFMTNQQQIKVLQEANFDGRSLEKCIEERKFANGMIFGTFSALGRHFYRVVNDYNGYRF